MSKHRSSIGRAGLLLVTIIASVALIVSDIVALDFHNQNANSSTTTDDTMTQTDANANRSMGRRRRGRRRARRGMRRSMPATTEMPAADTNTNTSGGMTDDFSGTYTGTINFPEHNMTGPATLTVSSNTYTMEGGGMTHSGNFIANTTRGYTGVAMEIGPTEAGKTPLIISLRARRLGGGGLSLMSVPGEPRKFSFTTAGGGRMRGRRGRRGSRAATAEPPDTSMTDTSGTTPDAAMPTDTTMTTDTTTTRRPGRRRRRGSRRSRPVMENANTGETTNENMTPTP